MKINTDIKNINDWGLGLNNKPIIISGPCSAESEEQVLSTAEKLSKNNIKIFRAGIWKPRTRPNCFEGVGSIGLEWLTKVKEQYGMLISTEVAKASHVKQALNAGIDILWIGARTTANPFAVQEIADELKGIDIPVLIKNPVNPDIELWIGAIERFNKIGINRIGAIHRGFSTYNKINYRNLPNWQIPIELKRRLPIIPIFTDPSHISGDSKYIKEISQKAMDLNFDGLMIESHCNPKEALSDANQQITPLCLDEMVQGLVYRNTGENNEVVEQTLKELRTLIDNFDNEILNLLENRMQIAKTIGHYKKENSLTILQSKRWDEILNNNIIKGKSKGLSKDFIVSLFKAIHQESINIQTNIMND